MGRNKAFQDRVDQAETAIHSALRVFPDTVRSAALSQAHRHDVQRRSAVKELSEAKRHYEELEKRIGKP